MKVKDFMTRQVVTVTPETSILDAARLMLDHKISGLPVVTDEGHVVGIISEHDLLRGGNSDVQTERSHWLRLMIERVNLTDESTRFQERMVCEVMTPDRVTITETAPLEEAGRLIGKTISNDCPSCATINWWVLLPAPISFELLFLPLARSRMRPSAME